MRRWYSNFPGGFPGIGLLLLRAAIGVSFVVKSSPALLELQGSNAAGWALDALLFVVGASFILGLLMPLAGAILVLTISVFNLWHLAFVPSLLNPLTLQTIAVVVAAVLLGPGAYSADAHLFGRRKIIIPRATNS